MESFIQAVGTQVVAHIDGLYRSLGYWPSSHTAIYWDGVHHFKGASLATESSENQGDFELGALMFFLLIFSCINILITQTFGFHAWVL